MLEYKLDNKGLTPSTLDLARSPFRDQTLGAFAILFVYSTQSIIILFKKRWSSINVFYIFLSLDDSTIYFKIPL